MPNQQTLSLIILTFIAGVAVGATQPPESVHGGDLVIANARVVSPDRDEVLEHAWIHIADGRIVRVSRSPVELAPGLELLDVEGAYVMPGLTDSHVHLGRMPGMVIEDGAPPARLEHLQAAYRKQEPRSYLYFGVTQLIDLASGPGAAREFDAHPLHPDLFYCGATPIQGGYPTVFAEKPEYAAAMFPYMIEPEADADHPASAESRVQAMSDDGAICTKIHIEDGFGLNSHWPILSDSSVKRIQHAAKTRQMPVVAHANAIDMQQIADRLQVDVIAHGLWNWNQHRGESSLPEGISKLLDRFIARRAAFQPTLTVIDSLRSTVAGEPMHDPLYRQSTPGELLEWYATAEARWFRRLLIDEAGGASAETIMGWQDATYEQGARVVRYLAENGGLLLLASDTPSSPVYVSQPGYNTRLEMRQMVAAGVSMRQLLDAATINNARAFGLESDYGTVAPGKIANLLVLQQNPLESVDAYDTITTVVLRGRPVERAALSAEGRASQ